jgi:predicted tellurium resistance membrane protein TerC
VIRRQTSNNFFVHHRYVAVYFSLLFLRYRAGIITKEMLYLPKVNFVVIGILEAIGVASGMSAGGST